MFREYARGGRGDALAGLHLLRKAEAVAREPPSSPSAAELTPRAIVVGDVQRGKASPLLCLHGGEVPVCG